MNEPTNCFNWLPVKKLEILQLGADVNSINHKMDILSLLQP